MVYLGARMTHDFGTEGVTFFSPATVQPLPLYRSRSAPSFSVGSVLAETKGEEDHLVCSLRS